MSSRRIALICNPSAGGGRALERLPLAIAVFERLEVEHRVVETTSIEHAGAEAGRAVENGETVAALGGDGLLRPLAGVLQDTPSALAIIPGGRGNDLARVLGIPTEPAEAARVAVEGTERRIDIGDVGGVPFLGIASFGFDSDANRLANEAKRIRGNLVYVYAALRALAAWKPASFTVTVDGVVHEHTGYTVAVANSKAYGGGMFMAPQAELDDGELDLVLIGEASKLSFVAKLPKVFKGEHVEEDNVTTLRGATIEVAASRPFEIYADGDPIGALPARIGVSRQALRVMVPG